MRIEDLKKRLEDVCANLNLPNPEITKQGFSFTKTTIRINPETSIEIFFNEEKQSLTSALVVQDKRVFGRDGYAGISLLLGE